MIALDYSQPGLNGHIEYQVSARHVGENGDADIVSQRVRLDVIEDRERFASFVVHTMMTMGLPVDGVARGIDSQLVAWLRQGSGRGLNIIKGGAFVDAHPEQPPALIFDLLRFGDVANLVSGPKTFKSYTVLALALCVATGLRFLGKFQCERSRVLLIDNELQPGTLAYRVRAVAGALGIAPREYADQLDVASLRNDPRDIDQIEEDLRGVPKGHYGLVVLDASYRITPPKHDENSNSDVTRFYNLLTRLAGDLGAAILVVHHVSKGNQSLKAVTDLGAGGGAQSRAADLHVAIRPHELDGAAVIETVSRSFKPLPPVGVRWDYPLWREDPTLNVTKLRRDPSKGGRPSKASIKEEIEAAAAAITPELFVSKYVTADPKPRTVIIAQATRDKLPLRAITGLLAESEHLGLMFVSRNGRSKPELCSTTKPDLFEKSVCARAHPHTPKAKRPKRRSPGK